MELRGSITSTGFTSGHRFVVGHWRSSPVGPFTDVMWADPGGHRRLLAPTAEARDFVVGVYRFDEEEVVDVTGALVAGPQLGQRLLWVQAGPVRLRLLAGRPVPLPPAPSPWLTRRLYAPFARRLLGVRTHGVSPTGVEEWYRASSYRRLVEARGTVAGTDLGAPAPIEPPTRFGFSEPPRSPSMVVTRPLLRCP